MFLTAHTEVQYKVLHSSAWPQITLPWWHLEKDISNELVNILAYQFGCKDPPFFYMSKTYIGFQNDARPNTLVQKSRNQVAASIWKPALCMETPFSISKFTNSTLLLIKASSSRLSSEPTGKSWPWGNAKIWLDQGSTNRKSLSIKILSRSWLKSEGSWIPNF